MAQDDGKIGAPSHLGRQYVFFFPDGKALCPDGPTTEAGQGQDLHLGTMLLGLLGAYFMLRVRAARKYGLFWLTLWLVYTIGRALLGFVHGNPDALAYFMLAYASIGVFGAFAVEYWRMGASIPPGQDKHDST